MIKEHEQFQKYQCRLFGELIGGSRLYGLDTPESDTDYRGIFIANSPTFKAGLESLDSIVTVEPDATYYELKRFFELLRKSNTQALEILFAPKSAFQFRSPWFDILQALRERLVDTDYLANSLKGYFHSEMRLATGERTGRLGGKRKSKVEEFGFSPKNFAQMIRLCEVGIHFFKTGEFIVNLREYNPTLAITLVDLKLNPGRWDKGELVEWSESLYKLLEKAIEGSTLNWKFDVDLAAGLILDIRNYA